MVAVSEAGFICSAELPARMRHIGGGAFGDVFVAPKSARDWWARYSTRLEGVGRVCIKIHDPRMKNRCPWFDFALHRACHILFPRLVPVPLGWFRGEYLQFGEVECTAAEYLPGLRPTVKLADGQSVPRLRGFHRGLRVALGLEYQDDGADNTPRRPNGKLCVVDFTWSTFAMDGVNLDAVFHRRLGGAYALTILHAAMNENDDAKYLRVLVNNLKAQHRETFPNAHAA